MEEMMEADIIGWVTMAARLNKPILVHPLCFSLDQGRPCLFCLFLSNVPDMNQTMYIHRLDAGQGYSGLLFCSYELKTSSAIGAVNFKCLIWNNKHNKYIKDSVPCPACASQLPIVPAENVQQQPEFSFSCVRPGSGLGARLRLLGAGFTEWI